MLEFIAEREHHKKIDGLTQFEHVKGLDFALHQLSPEVMRAITLSGYDAQIGEAGFLTTQHLAAYVVDDPELKEKLRYEAVMTANENDDEEDESEPIISGFSPVVRVSDSVKGVIAEAVATAKVNDRPATSKDILRVLLLDELSAREVGVDALDEMALPLAHGRHIWHGSDHVPGIMESVGADPLKMLRDLDGVSTISPPSPKIESATRRVLVHSR